jgi:DNA-binding CsgD family transcriptional regulator
VPLRVYLRGAAAELRAQLALDPHLEIVDSIDEAEAVLSRVAFARDDADGLRRVSLEKQYPPIEALTAREHDVLALLADGLSNRDIAARLDISEHTVKFHLASIFGKLGASTRTEAVQRGLRLGVIEI